MKKINFAALLVFTSLLINQIHSQTFIMSESGSYSTCSGFFYDGGGPGNNYPNNQNDTLTFYPSIQGGKISITFSSFQTQIHYNQFGDIYSIKDDILYVYNGNSTAAPLIGTLQGYAGPGTITSTAADGSLTFKFVSYAPYYIPPTGARAGWNASISCSPDPPTDITMIAGGVFTTCGGNFYDSGGPNGNYMDNQNGIVTTLYPAAPGEKISVTFSSFQTQIHYNKFGDIYSIKDDILYVYNGNSTTAPLIGTLQGKSGYGTIRSTASDGSLTFKFVSFAPYYTPPTGARAGWNATISCSPDPPADITMIAGGAFTTCGGNFYDSGGPNGDYMDNQDGIVTTLYPATPGAKISVTFSSFQTQIHYNKFGDIYSIKDDILYVYNGNSTAAPLIGALQGKSGYGTIRSTASDGSLTFKFVSFAPYYTPPTGARAGWNATISCSPDPPTDITMIAGGAFTTCGGNFYDSGGPNGNYMDNQDGIVTTLYPATPGAKISVTFSSFQTQIHYNKFGDIYSIKDDILYVFNGNSTAAPLIGTLQGFAGPGTISSTAADGSLTFRFVSFAPYYTPPTGARAGWNATISCSPDPPTDITMIAGGAFTTCGGHFYDSGGPNGDYMDNQNGIVTTLYPTTPGAKISVTFNSFKTQPNYSKFGNIYQIVDDILYIYNGPNTTSPLIAELSGAMTPGAIASTAADGSLTFKFVSYAPYYTPPAGARAGWDATISCSIVALSIIGQPEDQLASIGGTATFSVSAIGSPPITYQWRKNGVAIPGANSPSYATPELTLLDNGDKYSCYLTNNGGGYSATSNEALLTVTADCITPTNQASNVSFPSSGMNQMTIQFTKGSGSRRIVKMNTSNSFSTPSNGTDPAANPVYGGSGEQVVYNGNSNTVTVTGLAPNTTYWVRVYEAYCTGSSSLYNGTTAVGNPGNNTTLAAPSTVYSLVCTNVIPDHSNLVEEYTFYQDNTPYSDNQPIKVCADGSTATYFKVQVSNPSLVSFRILDENGNVPTDPGKYGQLGEEYTFFGNYVEVAYTHPRYMNASWLYRECTLQVLYNGEPISGASFPLHIYRAPIVFVHGFLGDKTTFEDVEFSLWSGSLYPDMPNSPLIHRVEYFLTSLQRFNVNKNVVPNGIISVFKKAREQNYSTGKAIVMGHSMGGILSRIYLQSSKYENDITKLVTINTPNYGTQFANWAELNFAIFSTIVKVARPLTIFSTGAIKDLKVNSREITMVLNGPLVEQRKVPSVTLSTDEIGDNSNSMGNTLRFVLSIIPDLYGEPDDLVVPMSSQRSGIFIMPIVPQQWHVGSCENLGIINQIKSLIDADPLGNSFTQNGFIPGELNNPFSIFNFDDNSNDPYRTLDSLQITSPTSGQEFLPNDNVQVDIFYSGDITQMGLIVYGNSIDPILIDTTAVEQLTFQIPDTALGVLNLFLLAGNSQGWIATDTVHIVVTPTIAADSIAVEPDTVKLALGLYTAVSVTGYFNGDEDGVSLIGVPGLAVEYDPAFLSYEGAGVFKGLSYGATSVVFSFQEHSDTAYFFVFDDPSVLIAAFDYSDDEICVNSSITFQDQSFGLATGYQWVFEGGVPTTSTAQNPVVNYPEAGIFSVSLKTTFENGIDSIFIDSLIIVHAPPEVTVLPDPADFCEGDTVALTASPNDAYYLWSTGETTQTILVSSPGTYAVTVAEIGNCAGFGETTVSIIPDPTIDLGPDTTLQVGQILILDASGPDLTYLWSTGADTPTLSVDSSGTYSVTVTNSDNCSASDSIVVTFLTSTIEQSGIIKITLYPNPADQFIHIKVIGSATTGIQIIDVLGKVILEDHGFEPDGSARTINLINISSGIYYVKIIGVGFVKTVRMVKSSG
ncbi:MAG: PKD domain-containing protein [Saprospiraceae bacterium]